LLGPGASVSLSGFAWPLPSQVFCSPGAGLSTSLFSCFALGPDTGEPGRFLPRASLFTPFDFLASFRFFFAFASVLEELDSRLPFSLAFFTFFLGLEESLDDDEDESDDEESVDDDDDVEDEEEERDLSFLGARRSGLSSSWLHSNCRASSRCRSSRFFSNIISSSCSKLFWSQFSQLGSGLGESLEGFPPAFPFPPSLPFPGFFPSGLPSFLFPGLP